MSKKLIKEHIQRIIEKSNYDVSKGKLLTEQELDFSDTDMNLDVEPEEALEDMMDEPEFEENLEDSLENLLDSTISNMDELGDEVGDKDGELEIGEGYVNEAGIGLLAAGTALAAPKIADMVGKGLSQLGKRVDSNLVRKAGEKLSDVGHRVHSTYENAIITGLKRLYPDKTDDFYKGAATAILLSATVALGISSISTAVGAAQAGKAGLAALEGGLGGVKAAEVMDAAKDFLPRVLSGFFK